MLKFFLSHLLILLNFNISVLAGFPNSYTLYNNYIDITTGKTYEVYFPYGNQYLTKDIENISMSLELLGSGIELLPDQIYDYYLTDDLINSNLNFPKSKVLDCDLIPKYKSQEIQKDKFLQGRKLLPLEKSNTKIAQFTAQANPNSTSATLKAGATGCIGISFKTTTKAKVGEISELTFNQNTIQSEGYEENMIPGTSTVAFITGDNQNRCDNAKRELFVNNQCVPKCENNQTISLTSFKCEVRTRICTEKEDTVNGNCYQKCTNYKVRDTNGICRDKDYGANSLIAYDNLENILKANLREYILFVVVIVILSLCLYFYTKKIEKKK